MSLPISPNNVDRLSAVRAHDILGTAPAAEFDLTTRVDSQLQSQDEDQARAQRYLESLLTSAPFGFAFFDRDLRFLRINALLAEMNGVSVAAHLGKTVAEIVPTLEPTLREATARILATGQPVLDHEISGEKPGAPGVTRYWNASWYPVQGEHGEIIGFSAVVVDITERKQAEAALQRTNACFELSVMASQVVLFQQDMELRYGWIRNPALGFDEAAVIGKRDADLFDRAEDAAHTEALKQEVIRSGVGMRQDVRVHIQNEVLHFDLLVEPMRDTAGVISGVTCAAIDITGRKRMEAAQLETERHYRALAEASAEIPYRMSADWSTMLPLDGRGLFASSDSPMRDWAWMDQYLPLGEQARVRQLVSDAVTQKKLFEMEHRVVRADGSTGWSRSRAVPILDENDNLVTWFGAASDITERKRIELNLIEATAVAEEANRAKSDLLSNMSHELRSPLNVILGFAQLIESGAPAPTPTQRGKLDHILQAGWHMLDMVNELLDLAQIESGNMSVTQVPVSLAEVMLECRAMMEAQANQRAITMTFPAFMLPVTVQADRTRLKQVMINLLSNAIKYNKAQGAVTVECALCSPDAIRISVRDTGEGLAPDQLAQLFQPFNRLGREAGPEQGTGIGLVLSRRLVELMGGAIGVESAVGVGSVFWFELKLASAEQVGSQ